MFGRIGQGALEYLLLIGGAIIVAVIVIGVLSGQASDIASDQGSPYASKCAALPDSAKCGSCGWADFDSDGFLDCQWDTPTTSCTPELTGAVACP